MKKDEVTMLISEKINFRQKYYQRKWRNYYNDERFNLKETDVEHGNSLTIFSVENNTFSQPWKNGKKMVYNA